MKKAVMISIRNNWCGRIAKGEKVVDMRRTAPLLRTPFTSYIYMSGKLSLCYPELGIDLHAGKVIGEFVCDKIECVKGLPDIPWSDPNGERELRVCKDSCLTFEQIAKYGEGSNLWAWHISELKLYDKPKELSEFPIYCNSLYEAYGDKCYKCGHYFVEGVFDDTADFYCDKRLTRPPQSWCYVEELV